MELKQSFVNLEYLDKNESRSSLLVEDWQSGPDKAHKQIRSALEVRRLLRAHTRAVCCADAGAGLHLVAAA